MTASAAIAKAESPLLRDLALGRLCTAYMRSFFRPCRQDRQLATRFGEDIQAYSYVDA